MKFYRRLLFILLPFFFTSCNRQQKPKYKYSHEETATFLNEIVTNAKVVIGDITEIEKQPTNELYISTRYSLSKLTLDAYNKNDKFYLENKNDDISDFTSYTYKDYELINEKGEKLQFVENGRAVYFREGGMGTYNNIDCQNLFIDIELNRNYETLKGYINIEFEMPKNIFGNMIREVKIPVQVNVYDKTTK